ncbi:MAG: hypothetical protein EA386_06935 [Rhodobacteraceae bacterium]|nr:MAG: hypothetical protein EA386_06935 [Paracoccaceae bacterium]
MIYAVPGARHAEFPATSGCFCYGLRGFGGTPFVQRGKREGVVVYISGAQDFRTGPGTGFIKKDVFSHEYGRTLRPAAH